MKIAIIGYGKMGHEVERVAVERGHEIVLRVDLDNTGDLVPGKLAAADAAIEFSTPQTARGNVEACLDAGIPVVCGTTGWNDGVEEVKAKCRRTGGTFFWASNFSIGVNIFFRINGFLAGMMGRVGGYGVGMREVHHIHKKDSPSGTAVTLADDIIDRIPGLEGWINEQTDNNSLLGIVSVREGEVPGTHEVVYRSDADEITIRHAAMNRRGFATGAVMAAEYTASHSGVLTMDDMLGF